MRVCSVVRNPPRASRTATAVPNEPAPTTIARLVGSDRLGRERTSGTSPSVRDPGAMGSSSRGRHLPFAMPIPSATAPPCAAIYAPYVHASAISFEEEAPDAARFAERIATTTRTHPWLVLEDAGRVVGFAYASQHRARAAYRWAADVGIYVDPAHQGQGAGRRLYEALFELMRRQNLRVACAGITLPNDASVGLHEALGLRARRRLPRHRLQGRRLARRRLDAARAEQPTATARRPSRWPRSACRCDG